MVCYSQGGYIPAEEKDPKRKKVRERKCHVHLMVKQYTKALWGQRV